LIANLIVFDAGNKPKYLSIIVATKNSNPLIHNKRIRYLYINYFGMNVETDQDIEELKKEHEKEEEEQREKLEEEEE
jgi:hypothetical protein